MTATSWADTPGRCRWTRQGGRPRAKRLGVAERPAPPGGKGRAAAPGRVRCRRRATQAPARTASPDGGTYTRRYHDQEHVNEYGHGGAAGRPGTGRSTSRANDAPVDLFAVDNFTGNVGWGHCHRILPHTGRRRYH